MRGQDTEGNADSEARYNGPAYDVMTTEQKRIRESILRSRTSTGLAGPFGPWLAVPSIAEPAQALGQACRFGTSLTFRESELVILLTGAKFESQTEFEIHRAEAVRAGLAMNVIDSIPHGKNFNLENVESNLCTKLDAAKEIMIVKFAAELLASNTVSDKTYNDTLNTVNGNHAIIVEITSIIGYYAYVAYTLNVFKIPLPTA